MSFCSKCKCNDCCCDDTPQVITGARRNDNVRLVRITKNHTVGDRVDLVVVGPSENPNAAAVEVTLPNNPTGGQEVTVSAVGGSTVRVKGGCFPLCGDPGPAWLEVRPCRTGTFTFTGNECCDDGVWVGSGTVQDPD